jgi:hypothetical protein
MFVRLLDTSISRDLCLYRQHDVALWLVHMQIFTKLAKSQTLIGLYLFYKNRIVRFGLIELYLFCKNQIVRFSKPDGPIFTTLASCLIFFYLSPLMPFCPFSSFKTPWIFKSSSLAHFLVLLWNYKNRILRFGKPDSLVFSALPNLIINTCPPTF